MSPIFERASAQAALAAHAASVQMHGHDFAPTAGEETISSAHSNSSRTNATGVMRVGFFQAKRTETINSMVFEAVTGAAATPTLVRYGIYSVNTSDYSLTALLASTGNDTTLLAATGPYEKALSAPFSKVAGTWYGAAILVVTAAAAPTIACALLSTANMSLPTHGRPRKVCNVSGQADLPASVAVGSMTSETGIPYVVLKP
jgi:hypothetical protein